MTDAFPNETKIEQLLIKNNNNLEETYKAIKKTNKPNENSDLYQLMDFIDSDYDFDTLFGMYEFLEGSIEELKKYIEDL